MFIQSQAKKLVALVVKIAFMQMQDMKMLGAIIGKGRKSNVWLEEKIQKNKNSI